MARVEMRPADLDHIPCLFCRVQSFPDGSSPRKYTIFHGQHRMSEVFAICDECAVELAEALAMGARMGSEQYLVGRQARPIRSLLYDLLVALSAVCRRRHRRGCEGEVARGRHRENALLDRCPQPATDPGKGGRRIVKLAEALSLRKSLDSKVGQLAEMLNKASWGYQGVEPKGAPSYQETDRAITDTLHQLQDLIERINLTNTKTTLTVEGESMTIMQAIARRDILGRKIGALRQAMQSMLNALQPSSRGWFERGEDISEVKVGTCPTTINLDLVPLLSPCVRIFAS